MDFNFWKKTGVIKPFNSIDEIEKYCDDIVKDPLTPIKVNTALNRSNVKKGYARGNKYYSFAEFTFCTYMEKVKHYSVERNDKVTFLTYFDDTGKVRKYYPDFIVNGAYYEVKGRLRPLDELKRRQHPEVTFVFQEEMKNNQNILIIIIMNMKIKTKLN